MTQNLVKELEDNYGLNHSYGYSYYSDSFAVLFHFLQTGILEKVNKNNIENFLIINYNLGLKCRITDAASDIDKYAPLLKKNGGKFTCELFGENGLINSIIDKTIPNKSEYKYIATCSPSILVEQYDKAEDKVQEFLNFNFDVDGSSLEELYDASFKKVNQCSQKAKTKSCEFYVLKSLLDLPITIFMLSFKEPITLVKGSSNPISSLFAIAMYDPIHPVDAVDTYGSVENSSYDLTMPIQIRLNSPGSEMRKLAKSYIKRIEKGESLAIAKNKARIFVSYREKDFFSNKIANYIKDIGTRNDIEVELWPIVFPKSKKDTNLEKFMESAGKTDYAIAIVPVFIENDNKLSFNVPYEFGYFIARLGLKRTLCIINKEDSHNFLSNIDGYNSVVYIDDMVKKELIELKGTSEEKFKMTLKFKKMISKYAEDYAIKALKFFPITIKNESPSK